MPICPVCEHQQQSGAECEVCGKDLSGAGPSAGLAAAPVAVQPVEGLETRPEQVGEVQVAPMPDLDLARQQVGDVQVELVPGVEATRQAQVGEVPVERMGELSEDRAAPVGPPTPVAQGPVTCRYCRNVQPTGVICDRCGMRLPVIATPVVQGVATGRKVEPVTVRCKACGAPAKAGQRCTECGRETPWPDQ